MKALQTLQCDDAHPVATVTLHRPEALNALNAAMLTELAEVFGELAADPAVRVILLTGSGQRAFAAGADIRELLQTDAASGKGVSEHGQQVFTSIERCGKPVIACINGFAFGGGLELAMACTLRLASEDAQLGLPEAKLGLIPGFGGVQRLVRLVGRGRALRMMLTAHTVNAAEAQRMGLVEEVVPAADLMTKAHEIAAAIARLAPLALRGVLEAVARQENTFGDEGFRVETEIFGRLCGTADKHEGLTAFVEKRTPSWRGE